MRNLITAVISTMFILGAFAIGAAVGHYALGGNTDTPATAVTTPTTGGGVSIPAGVTVSTGGVGAVPPAPPVR